MEILGLIPARGGSKGIKGKNIKPLGGRPLIEYTFDAALESKLLSRVILSTDSEEIAEIGKRCGIEVPFLRPADISTDESPAYSYIQHCLDFLKNNEAYEPGFIVILQPTTPFRHASDIDLCVTLLLQGGYDSVVSVAELPNKYHPDWYQVIGPDGLLRPYAQRSWEQVAPRRQELTPSYIRNGAVYAFRQETFLKTRNIYGTTVTPYIMPTERSINIDDMSDWQRAEVAISTNNTNFLENL